MLPPVEVAEGSSSDDQSMQGTIGPDPLLVALAFGTSSRATHHFRSSILVQAPEQARTGHRRYGLEV